MCVCVCVCVCVQDVYLCQPRGPGYTDGQPCFLELVLALPVISWAFAHVQCGARPLIYFSSFYPLANKVLAPHPLPPTLHPCSLKDKAVESLLNAPASPSTFISCLLLTVPRPTCTVGQIVYCTNADEPFTL